MKGFRKLFWLILFCPFIVKGQQSWDILIKNAEVFDGSGKPSEFVDVGVLGDKIVFVGKAKENVSAKRVIDGKGLILAPGFIDPHTHYVSQLNHDSPLERRVHRALFQGVTTVFEGNDGSSPLPIGNALQRWEEKGIGPNVGLFVGHNSIRREVLGSGNVQPSVEELAEMENWVKRSMEEGAFGLSTGLFYNPGNFAKTDEVIALAKVAARYGGIYDTHQRDEGSQNIGVVASTQEVLHVAENANIPVHFSHIKVAGPKVWGKSDTIIQLIENAQKKGLNVTANQYPYVASRTGLHSALVPAWALDGGVSAMRIRFRQSELRDSIINGINKSIESRTADPAKLFLSSRDEQINGKSLEQLSKEMNLSPAEVVIAVCMVGTPSVHSFMMKEYDVRNFMKQPWVMIGSDGGSGHPRAFGSFAKVISEYAIQNQVLTLSEAIYKSTYLTAKTLNIDKRGLIKEGFFADLILFDPKSYKANSNFENGEQLASGMYYVIINGVIAIDNQTPLSNLPGKTLKLN